MFKILYGDSNPFEGIAPTPFVERDISPIYYAKKQGNMESFSLRGMITGNYCQDGNEFSGFWGKGQELVNRFSKSFQRFQIIEDLGESTGHLYSNGHAIIRSIDFEDSIYAGAVPFSISLDVFREGSFANYGILEPDQTISFEQKDNGDVSVQKSTSAKGFNTDLPALENATLFVQSLTGRVTDLEPAFISSDGMMNAVLISLNEKINRLDGSYEVTEEWLYNNYGNMGDYSIFEKTTTIDSNDDGIQVSINGRLEGGMNETFANLRQDFNNIDFFGFAEEIYESNVGGGELYVKPLSKQIEENSAEKTVTFTLVYSDKLREDPYIVDSLTISNDVENNKICVQGSVEIRSVDNCPYSRWSKVNGYADSFSIVTWIKDRVLSLGYSLNLPNKAVNTSSSYNEQNGIITISATLCDKKISIPNHFDDFVYTVSVVPAMPSFVPFQGLDQGGDFTIQKLGGLKRRAMTIQGNGQISNCSTYEEALASLKTRINNLKNLYLEGDDAFLTQHDVQRGYGSLRNKISFSFGWNENAEKIFPDGTLHSSL